MQYQTQLYGRYYNETQSQRCKRLAAGRKIARKSGPQATHVTKNGITKSYRDNMYTLNRRKWRLFGGRPHSQLWQEMGECCRFCIFVIVIFFFVLIRNNGVYLHINPQPIYVNYHTLINLYNIFGTTFPCGRE